MFMVSSNVRLASSGWLLNRVIVFGIRKGASLKLK